ncbi:VOC family protein [Aestuariicella sp. G3-2]|uniref:VOC family protein n=1 Tax=Pseudomaricurvus albidus TaxID=2842452 RepID=UPI001C0D0034|nr:VOC family protein [Aestuariicella albida]MBU3069511.1 VOC family protein [Aestuariicella albida]
MTSIEDKEHAQDVARLDAVILSVTDPQVAKAFYQAGANMQSVTSRDVAGRVALSEDTLWLKAADGRGALLGLKPAKTASEKTGAAKLVFYVKDVDRYADALVAAGGELVLSPVAQPGLGGMRVGFGRGFDGQLIEFVGMPDADHSYLSAVGISVSDLEVSRDYYLQYLGWSQTHFLSVPEQYDEYIMMPAVTGSSALVLMWWQPGVNLLPVAPPELVFSSLTVGHSRGDHNAEMESVAGSESLDPDGHALMMVAQ